MRAWFKMTGFFCVCLLLWIPAARAAEEGPDALLAGLSYKGKVNDFAGVLPSNELASLEESLLALERVTTAQVAVVTLDSLQGGDVNDFANRLFEKWGVGQKKMDNGILFLVAIQDRKMRIEVGYGFEGILPDAKTGRLLDDHVIPYFKQTNYAAGIVQGTLAIADAIAREAGVSLTNLSALATNLPAGAGAPAKPMSFGAALFMLLVIFGFFALLVWAMFKGKSGGGGSSSGGGSSHSSSSSSSSSFGGGSSGGGGASRSW